MDGDRRKRRALKVAADAEIARAIMLGAAAGACRTWAVKDPKVAPGMTKAADAYSKTAAGLLTEWGDGQ